MWIAPCSGTELTEGDSWFSPFQQDNKKDGNMKTYCFLITLPFLSISIGTICTRRSKYLPTWTPFTAYMRKSRRLFLVWSERFVRWTLQARQLRTWVKDWQDEWNVFRWSTPQAMLISSESIAWIPCLPFSKDLAIFQQLRSSWKVGFPSLMDGFAAACGPFLWLSVAK